MKKCAVINDLSGFGKCSLTVSIPILSVMGCEAHPLPTAVLSNQTAYSSYSILDFTPYMNDYVSEWCRHSFSFDAILTGFTTSEYQLDIINDIVNRLRGNNTILVVDPVMADNGSLYDGYTDNMCNKIRSLCMKADAITPNIAELAYLVNKPYSEDLDTIISYGEEIVCKGVKGVVVTGYKSGGSISNIVFEENAVNIASAQLHGGYFSGTGDILSSIITGGLLRGMSLFDSTVLATEFIEKAVKNTVNDDPNAGIYFEKFLKDLI